MNTQEIEKLIDNLYDYVDEQKEKADISEEVYNILQNITDKIIKIQNTICF